MWDKEVCKFSSEISSFDGYLENNTGNILVIYLVTLMGGSILCYWWNYNWWVIRKAVRKIRPSRDACIKVCESSCNVAVFHDRYYPELECGCTFPNYPIQILWSST
jgi:hypothetical protein